MKSIITVIALVVCSIATNAQTTNAQRPTGHTKTDTITLPAPAPQAPKLYYVVMTGPDWDNLVTMLMESSYPSTDVNKYRKYIAQNIHELVLPQNSANGKDSTAKKK
jgi:hypothetical protein